MKRNTINNLVGLLCCLLILQSCKKDDQDSKLTARFKSEQQQVLSGESVLFTDLSEGQPSSWTWTFEGGVPATSDLSSPTVTYAQPGTYEVTLEVKRDQNSSIEKKTGYIIVGYRDVAADFEVSTTTILQDESITFTDKSIGMPTSWAWEFKSGSTALTSSQKSPVVKFSVPGVYTVSLTVTNPKGSNTVIRDAYLTVIDKTSIEADFEADQTATFTGGTIKFTDKSVGFATSWNWTFEGAVQSSSNLQNPTVTYTAPGRFKVKLVSSNAAKSSTTERESYILVVPGQGLTAFYPFNGSINDFGPDKLASTRVGDITFTPTDRKARAGETGIFNGSGGFIVADNEAMNFGTGDYSVSCWIKTNSNTRGMIWQESGKAGSGDNQTWLRLLGSASNLTSFSTEDPSGGSTINLTTANAGTKATTFDGVWHHIVCVRQGTNTKIYIDGEMIREANSGTGIKVTSNSGVFKVGMQENATGYLNHYTGMIDDLIIYKKALTASEVTILKNL